MCLHQLDLKVQNVYSSIECEGGFVDQLNNVIHDLRVRFKSKFSSLCPRFVSTRWLSMERVTKWLVENKSEIVQHYKSSDKVRHRLPPPVWWVWLAAINRISRVLKRSVERLQGYTTLLQEQENEIRALEHSLDNLIAVKTCTQGEAAPEDSYFLENVYILGEDVDLFIADSGVSALAVYRTTEIYN